MANVSKLRIWCQKVLPLVYDDSLSYYEVLCKVVDKLNEMIGGYGNLNELLDALKTDVNQYTDQAVTHGIAQSNAYADQKVLDLGTQLNQSLAQLQFRVATIEADQPEMQANINQLLKDMGEVQQWIAQFDWDRLYQMVADIIADYIPSQLSVGLTSDGYFVITFWKPWLDLVFNTTGYDIETEIQPEFGHLVVSY